MTTHGDGPATRPKPKSNAEYMDAVANAMVKGIGGMLSLAAELQKMAGDEAVTMEELLMALHNMQAVNRALGADIANVIAQMEIRRSVTRRKVLTMH